MKWFVKHAVQSAFSLLVWPELYRWGQKHVTRSLPGALDDKMLAAERHLRALHSHFGAAALPPLNLYEIGAGWTPMIALIMSLTFEGHFTLVDQTPWLDDFCLGVHLESLKEFLPKLQQLVPDQPVGQRYQRRRQAWAEGGRSALLKEANCDYLAPADARALPWPAASFDAVISTNVLEHVPRPELLAIHRESFRLLKPGGIALHDVDLCDHRSGGDPEVHPLAFLRWPARWWFSPLFTNRYNYVNRLRETDQVRIMEDAGFEVLGTDPERREEDLAFVARLPLAPEFRDDAPEQLIVRRTYIRARKP